ncbi:MAG TPA: response regulator [Archangium sp.]|nr:response regulator [Archangium sp.]
MNITPTHETRPLRVLVVEDDESVLRIFTHVFECLGNNELHLAHTVMEARWLLEEVMIDIAFIAPRLAPDSQKREGITLLQEIRGRYQTVPIVVGKATLGLPRC